MPLLTTDAALSLTDIALIAAALGFAVVLFSPRVLKSRRWRATVTPLASIIGSGFLVAGPILSHVAGNYAWAAMLFLCGTAYLFGAAVRHNIAHVEGALANDGTLFARRLERVSEIALSLAYFISIAYYLNLFAAFGLRLGDITAAYWVRITATCVIGAVGVVGVTGGLTALEHLEIGAVDLKLAVIGGLFVALTLANSAALVQSAPLWSPTHHDRGVDELRILLGLVILVQGFETSRYLGAEYDGPTRVRTMQWAQWLSSGIYLAFILLVTHYFTGSLPREGGETAIIDMLRPVGIAVAPMLITIALASQLSAAVADMNGAGGLIAETSGARLSANLGHLIAALVAIAITWAANIYEIITYASRAFVIYYALQSFQAMRSAWDMNMRGRAALFAFAVLLAVVIVIFAEAVKA